MQPDTTDSRGNKTGLYALVIGLVGCAIAMFGFMQGWRDGDVRPIMSWLIGIGFWLSIALGMLFLIQIWYVFHARWPVIIRRQCEHFISAFPYLLILFFAITCHSLPARKSRFVMEVDEWLQRTAWTWHCR